MPEAPSPAHPQQVAVWLSTLRYLQIVPLQGVPHECHVDRGGEAVYTANFLAEPMKYIPTSSPEQKLGCQGESGVQLMGVDCPLSGPQLPILGPSLLCLPEGHRLSCLACFCGQVLHLHTQWASWAPPAEQSLAQPGRVGVVKASPEDQGSGRYRGGG